MNDAVNSEADQRGAHAGCLRLGAACTIHEAHQLQAQLLSAAGHPGPYEIDAGGVLLVDTAGVQLLVAFALDCMERNVSYSWKARSTALDEAIQLLGVSALLESPS
jgi:anti-anti-sigma regulatory factor